MTDRVTQVAAQVPQQLADRLAAEAKVSDRSVSAVIRMALREYLERAESQREVV